MSYVNFTLWGKEFRVYIYFFHSAKKTSIEGKRKWYLNSNISISCSVIYNSLQFHGWKPARLLCPWDSPRKNTGVGCHSLLQGIFLTHELNPGLLHCRQILYCLNCKGSYWTLTLRHLFSRKPVNGKKNNFILLVSWLRPTCSKREIDKEKWTSLMMCIPLVYMERPEKLSNSEWSKPPP